MKTTKLKCVITGRTLFATNDYYQRKVEQAGSEDKLRESYICKEAKNMIKQGYTVDKIREMLSVDLATVGEVDEQVLQDVLNTGKSYLRNSINQQVVSLANSVVHRTDPEVKEFLEKIMNR